MSFTSQYAAVRILKRSRRLRGRPQWQDEVPKEQAARDTYKIAAKYQKKFSAAFLQAVRNILPVKMSPEFKKAYDQGSVMEALNSLPLFNEGEQNNTWERFTENLQSAYLDVMQESGQVTTKELNDKFKTKLGFVVDIEKAKAKKLTPGMRRVREAARGLVVPVNPYSIKWMQDRGIELVTQGISEPQREVIHSVLNDGFERGLRAEVVYGDIKNNIGLTDREFNAVRNREIYLEDVAGYTPRQAKVIANDYRQKLLVKRAERIGRTETIMSQARGRQDAWKLAEESGQLPSVQRRWITSEPTDNPDRPCETCLDLDGKTAPIGGMYESLEGPIDGPTAHPSCRCSESLEKKKG